MTHLAVVDTQTGEVQETCEGCTMLRDQLAGAERDVRAWRIRYAKLARDKDADAHNHAMWDEVEVLFSHWKSACCHPRSKLTTERFELARPFMEREGMKRCRQAINGAAHDPYVTPRKNGSIKRHDDWGLIFRDADKFEEFCNRAPRGET